jgi:tetratricopeptide (TPR) repeat protein
MADDVIPSAPTPAAPMPTASATIFLGTFALMAIAIAALLALDLFLTRIDRRESAAHAANLYADGIALLARHQPEAAEEKFAEAVAIERANTSYALALGEARLEQGQTAEAEATLRALLERAENDGAVNLVMAHTLQRSGRLEEAKAYYHRAIFGRWGADSVQRRRQVRFELIDLLAARGSGPELLAELLPFEDTPPDSVALQQRLAKLFIIAGSPARAVNSFREVLRRDPKNADAYAGIGDAEMALGNFRTARADFAAALRLRPGDTSFVARVTSADSVLALDPTARGIGPAMRLSRSRALLERTLAAVIGCGQFATPLNDVARGLLGARTDDARRDVMTDSLTEVAMSLWAARPPSCGTADRALELLHARLAADVALPGRGS